VHCLANHIFVLAQVYNIVIALRHFLPIPPRQTRCRGQQRLRLQRDQLAVAFEKSEQTLTVDHRQIFGIVQYRLGLTKRILAAMLLEIGLQLVIGLGMLTAKLLESIPDLLFKVPFLPYRWKYAERMQSGYIYSQGQIR